MVCVDVEVFVEVLKQYVEEEGCNEGGEVINLHVVGLGLE